MEHPFPAGERDIFTYHNGIEEVKGDPLQIFDDVTDILGCDPQIVINAFAPKDSPRPAGPEALEARKRFYAAITEAFEMARLRAVDLEALDPLAQDPDVLTDVGQFLPAALLATNVTAEAVATDLTRGAD